MAGDTAEEGARPVLQVDGRLDAQWSAHLEDRLRDLLRSGRRSVVLDLSRVSFVSSAGIGVLTRCAREFIALRGELFVGDPPPAVVEGLGLAGLGEWILHSAGEGSERRLRASGGIDLHHTRDWHAPSTPVSRGSYEVAAREAGASLLARVYGAPLAIGNALEPSHYPVVSFAEPTFGIGIGALGTSMHDAQARSGELLAAGGAVIHLPTDDAAVPDYLVSLPNQPPRAVLLTGLTCAGGFSHLVRFGPARRDAAVPLSEVAAVCLDAARSNVAGVVMVVETRGLVGAYLRRSPLMEANASLDARALRERLTITAAASYQGTSALIVGVIARDPEPVLAAHLRPLAPNGTLLGHFHAAVFSYRPVPQRTVIVRDVVENLLGEQELRAALHLLIDDRERGAGESYFVRGLAWTAPVATVTLGET